MPRPTDASKPAALHVRSDAGERQRRIVVLGQPERPDGAPEEGLEAQMQRAWLNLFDAIQAAGYEKHHLVKTTVCVTEGGQLKLFRTVRDRMMRGHVVASAYLHVAGLGVASHLVEIEGELMQARS